MCWFCIYICQYGIHSWLWPEVEVLTRVWVLLSNCVCRHKILQNKRIEIYANRVRPLYFEINTLDGSLCQRALYSCLTSFFFLLFSVWFFLSFVFVFMFVLRGENGHGHETSAQFICTVWWSAGKQARAQSLWHCSTRKYCTKRLEMNITRKSNGMHKKEKKKKQTRAENHFWPVMACLFADKIGRKPNPYGIHKIGNYIKCSTWKIPSFNVCAYLYLWVYCWHGNTTLFYVRYAPIVWLKR